MANAQRGEVSLEIGETTYTLRLGRNALATAETVLGKTWPDIVRDLDGFATQRAVLWAGLQQYHPKLSLLDVGDLMDELSDEDLIGEKLAECLKVTFPKKADQIDAAVNPQKPGEESTGTPT